MDFVYDLEWSNDMPISMFRTGRIWIHLHSENLATQVLKVESSVEKFKIYLNSHVSGEGEISSQDEVVTTSIVGIGQESDES